MRILLAVLALWVEGAELLPLFSRLKRSSRMVRRLADPVLDWRDGMPKRSMTDALENAVLPEYYAQQADPSNAPVRQVLTTTQVGGDTLELTRFTGAGDPGWSYPQTEVPSDSAFPDAWPYTEKDFLRMDEGSDADFYPPGQPRLLYHIDEGAVSALTRYYADHIPEGSDILDVCSSWVSHYPRGIAGIPDFKKTMQSITGTGMQEFELQCNDQLTSYKQADLNAVPKLPYPDGSFDVVTCVVSFDYLTRPLEVMQEIARVLRPGGKVILSQSNRCFFTKAVGVWTQDMSDEAHLRYLRTVVHFAGGLGDARVFDITPKPKGLMSPGLNDPMFVVEATKA
jgi:hypothetical protein